MAMFLEDISRFYGNGERNANGESLEEFLEGYDPYRYQTPSCTTDALIFAYSGELREDLKGLKVLLVERGNHPSIGAYALPGGFVELKENLEVTARRELEEETGVRGLRMEQLATYGDYDRDPRTRVITTAYMALVKEEDVKVQAGDDAADAMWCDVSMELTEAKWQGEVSCDTYTLRLRNESRKLDTTAVVERTWTEGLIREEKFRVVDIGQTASDHAAIIVHGLVALKKRLEMSENR